MHGSKGIQFREKKKKSNDDTKSMQLMWKLVKGTGVEILQQNFSREPKNVDLFHQ